MTSLGIAIVDWEAISSLGLGAQAFGQPECPEEDDSAHPLRTSAADFPQDLAYRPAHFNVAELLGEKGIRTMDRTTALAVCTAKLLHRGRANPEQDGSEGTGFVLGSSTGSIRSTSDFTRDSLTQDRPFLVNPALFPNTVMNCASGQCAIWFKARSVNATISGGRLSGLLALKYAAQTLRRGYASRLFTGSVEELCPQTAWAHRQLVRHGRRHPVPLGEGCALFELERAQDVQARGVEPVAEILALAYGRYFDNPFAQEAVEGVSACMTEALHQCALSPRDVDVCMGCGGADAAIDDIERQAIQAVLGEAARLPGPALMQQLGETYSASFSLALGALIADLRAQLGGHGIGMALAVGEDGHAGCLILRV